MKTFFRAAHKELKGDALKEKQAIFPTISKSLNDYLYDLKLETADKFSIAKYLREQWEEKFACSEEAAKELTNAERTLREKILDSIDYCPLFKDTNPVRFHAEIENIRIFLALKSVLLKAKDDINCPGYGHVNNLNVSFAFAEIAYDCLKPIVGVIRYMDSDAEFMVRL